MAAATPARRQLTLLLLQLIFPLALADSCIRGQYNLTTLQAFNPWHSLSDSTNGTIYISLCEKLAPGTQNCTDGTSVCLKYPNGTVVSYGNYSSDQTILPSAHDVHAFSSDLLLVLKGQPCSKAAGEFFSTFIHFRCGKTLGYPNYLRDLPCFIDIEWESYIFCKKLPVPESEVPCTVVKDGHLIDLSPLTKLSGGYLVDDNSLYNRTIFINVCRDITPVTSDGSQKCPKGSGSCKVVNDIATDFGKPTKGVEVTTSGVVKLEYTSLKIPVGCLDTPKTIINFVCPERGGSKNPVLVEGFVSTCTLEIEWVTEYACPADHIASKTCQLTMGQHNINFDLSPLTRDPTNPYAINVTDGADHYKYLINICGHMGVCGSNHQPASVCQTKFNDTDFSRSVGISDSMTLRYSDNKLTMIMKHGDTCSTNYMRDSVFEFICNKTADNDGKGYPEFVESSNCSYYFQWDTKYACPDHLLDDTCQLTVDGRKFDLSPLVREEGTNWEVITGQDEKDQTFFLNVCHDILTTGEASSCPPGSAVCRTGSDKDKAVSLGRYTQPLRYDKGSKCLRLVYTQEADMSKSAKGCEVHTTVSFCCSPGKLDSAPQLVHKSEDGCHYEIEWHTSAACVLSHQTGDNCKVVDDQAGYVFDLNPLTYSNGSYAVAGADGYNYLINVCASIKNDKFCNSPPHDNAAICQVKIGQTSEDKKVAEPTAKLEYFDGVLNLTYTNGEPYNNAEHTPRMAEIAFLCDMAVGSGKPEFVEERNYTYVFQWRSSYACPMIPLECVVKDATNHAEYDLSSLTRLSENWKIETLQEPKKKFYINVCQPLRPIHGVVCSPSASVCATSLDNGKETLFHGNLGRPESPPVIERSIKGVRLVYANGDTCNDTDGTIRNFQTTVHFVCVQGNTGGPSPPQQINPCEYSIIWETDAACPITNVNVASDTCQITDPNSNFTFNLMSLYAVNGYNVTEPGSTKSYTVNICGGLPDSACGKFDSTYPSAICELSPNGISSLARFSNNLTYSSNGRITIAYLGHMDFSHGGAQKTVQLNLDCDRTAQSPVITFDSQLTLFTVRTALACPPKAMSCVTQDSLGRQFDLSPLAKQTDNWIVPDPRPGHANMSYHINVCRPVNPTPGMSCPGAVGGCQTSSAGNFSMGYVQSEPVVSSVKGVITIVYKGGDKCRVDKEVEVSRSTRIIFTCDTVEHGPVFEPESNTDTCEFTFMWRTPAACPQQVTTGSDCKVTDPLYNYEFDLSSLHRASDNYNIPGNGYQFLLNVCGPLVDAAAQCGQEGVSSCQRGSTLPNPIPIGISNDKPIYNSGQISLIYLEGKGSCHKNFTRSTIINFVCDHSKTGDTLPQYVEEKSDCTYVFEWPTSVVCPPRQITDCTFKYGDDLYDLTRLTKVDGNYEHVYESPHVMYIINICRSLVYKKGQTCPFEAAACKIDLDEADIKNKFHSIGDVSSHSIRYDHGTIILRYWNGDLCKGRDDKTRSSTAILFKCDPSSDALGTPSHFTINDCEEHFVWTSSAACPLKRQIDNSTGFGNCKVANPNTGYTFDLSVLNSPTGYTTYDREGHAFTLNVCGWLSNTSPCKNGTGSCQVAQVGNKTGKSAGVANAHLIYRDGVLVLTYSDGDKCDGSEHGRTTYINFVCSPNSGNGLPVYVDKTEDCQYYFDWHTQLVCETEFACEVTTDSGHTLDLSPLVKKSGKYNVLPSYTNQQQGSIYINLCRPLNPIFGTLCPAGSGACLVREGDKPLSLGRVDTAPVWDITSKHVKVTYTHGDPCPAKPTVNMTSIILLKCGTQEQMEPQLLSGENCQFVFMWETALACTEKPPQQLTSNCTFYDYIAHTKYNLSSLSDPVNVVSSHGGTFSINVCGHLQDKGDKGNASCAQSSVCLSGGGNRDGSYGSSNQGVFYKETDFVVLKFSNGRPCHLDSTKAVSAIYFVCDRSAGKGTPEITDEGNECEVMFQWKTSLVCPMDKQECLVATSHATYDLTVLSQDVGSWNVIDKDKNTYWLNLCQGLHGPAISAGCPLSAAVCRKSPQGKVQMLGQLDTQRLSVSDGPAPNVIVQYSEGDPDVCNSGRRRRSDVTPIVIINMTCGSTVGSPVLQQHSMDNGTKCHFVFSWVTSIACDIGLQKVQVKENNGLVTDARTKMTIDLRPLLSMQSIEQVIDGKKYILNLGGPVQLNHSLPGWPRCEASAVCLLSLDSMSFKNLGNFSSRVYYIKDDHLEVVLTSNEKCANNTLNVTTTITFTCNSDKDETKPEFFDQPSDCNYIFNWDTSLVCLNDYSSMVQDGGVANSGNSATSGVKVAIGLSVLVALVLACVLALVLHKPERRAVIGSKLKNVVCWGKREDNPIIYSRLSQADNEDSIIDGLRDPFNPFSETDDETEINNSQLPVRPATYRDDSDEDMLL